MSATDVSLRQAEPSRLTILELLDVLETRIVLLRAHGQQALSPDSMRAQIEKAGFSREDFAALFAVPYDTCQEWLSGKGPIPAWIQPALQMLSLLSATERKRLLNRPKAASLITAGEKHPFSRLEEL